MEIKTLKTEKKMPFKKKEFNFKKYEPMPMMKRPMGKPKPVEENPTKISPGSMRRADTTTMEKYKKQGTKPTSTTTSTPPLPRTKKAEAPEPKGPGMMERAKAGVEKVKSGLFSLLPSAPGKLTYNEESFEPEKKMVGKAQRGMKSYLKGSMGKGGM